MKVPLTLLLTAFFLQVSIPVNAHYFDSFMAQVKRFADKNRCSSYDRDLKVLSRDYQHKIVVETKDVRGSGGKCIITCRGNGSCSLERG